MKENRFGISGHVMDDEQDSLNEFAKAHSHLIHCDDRFVYEAQEHMGSDFGWTPRMMQFMMPIWKLRSKIEDLKLELDLLLESLRILIHSTNALVREIEPDSWNITKLQMIRDIHQRIEFVLEFYSATLVQKLLTYKLKALKMVSRIQREQIGHLLPHENSTKIMDPGLNLDVVQDFIAYGMETICLAGDMNIEYTDLYCSYLDTRVEFCEKAGKSIKSNAQSAKEKESDVLDSEIPTASGIQLEEEPEPLDLMSDQHQHKQQANQIQGMNYLLLGAVLCSICSVFCSDQIMEIFSNF